MNNRQAAHLPCGAHIRRKNAPDDAAIYIVERIERAKNPSKDDAIVYAGGYAFRPWQIERVDPMSGWPQTRETRWHVADG